MSLLLLLLSLPSLLPLLLPFILLLPHLVLVPLLLLFLLLPLPQPLLPVPFDGVNQGGDTVGRNKPPTASLRRSSEKQRVAAVLDSTCAACVGLQHVHTRVHNQTPRCSNARTNSPTIQRRGWRRGCYCRIWACCHCRIWACCHCRIWACCHCRIWACCGCCIWACCGCGLGRFITAATTAIAIIDGALHTTSATQRWR